MSDVTPAEDPVALVENLIVRYPEFRLGPISLRVPAGAIVGLVGALGSDYDT